MSLFGHAERREITALKAANAKLRAERNTALEDAATERAAKKTAARLVNERDRDVLRLGQMLTREVVDAEADVAAERARATRYLAAWRSARRRAATRIPAAAAVPSGSAREKALERHLQRTLDQLEGAIRGRVWTAPAAEDARPKAGGVS